MKRTMKSIAGVVHHPGGRWANLQSPSGGGTLTASSSSSQVGMPAGGSFLRLEQVIIIWDFLHRQISKIPKSVFQSVHY